MRAFKLVVLAFAAVLLGFLIDPARSDQTGSSTPDEKLPSAEVDANAFGFSISELAASVGVKLRGLLGSKPAVEQVREIADPAALEYDYYRAASNVLSVWTTNSAFSGLVRVNQPLKPGFINLFIVRHSHLQEKAQSLSCGCSYVPGSWSIVCDGLFLASAQRLLESPTRAAEPASDAPGGAEKDGGSISAADMKQLERDVEGMFRGFLFEWILAHELGHLVNNHSEKDLARAWKYGEGIPVGLAAEKEADEYYISRLQHDSQRQFSAWFGLSNVVTRLYSQAIREQYSEAQIRSEIEKDGPRFVLAANLEIRLRYAPTKHPPLLLRALNLSDAVLARYPQLWDNSGYFDRVRAHIRPEAAAEPDTPKLCHADTGKDDDNSEEQVLAKQADILLAQSAPEAWKQAIVAKLRQTVSRRKDGLDKLESVLATDLVEALAQPDVAITRKALEKIESASEPLPEPARATLRLLAIAGRARAGLLPENMSIAQAVAAGQDRIAEMAKGGAVDLSESFARAEVLRLLLQIALTPNRERDDAADELIERIVATILDLPEIPRVDGQLIFQILQGDFTRLSEDSPPRDRTLARARAAMRLAALADRQKWPALKANYLAASLALMEQMKPKPQTELVTGYLELGHELMMLGLTDQGTSVFQKALDGADVVLADPNISPDDRTRLTEARLVLLNDLGWALLMAQKFSDAAAPLQAAREGRERLRAGRARCDKDQRDDVEFATVNQNLADVSLALGRFDEALRYAHQARQCRTELGRARKALESMKTEGYALIYRGDESAGKEFLQTYSDSIRRDRDDVILPAGDPFISGAIVAGKFVPLEQFVRLPDKYAEPKPKPSSAPDDQEMEKK